MPLPALSQWPGRQPCRPRLVDGRRGGGPSSVAPRSRNPPTGRRRDSPISSSLFSHGPLRGVTSCVCRHIGPTYDDVGPICIDYNVLYAVGCMRLFATPNGTLHDNLDPNYTWNVFKLEVLKCKHVNE